MDVQQDVTPKRELRTMKGSFADVPAGHGAMAVLDRTGDTKFMWDKSNAEEVAMARDNFNGFRKKGYLAFKVTDKDGTKGEQADEFDPNAERYIFSPPMKGG